jgi:peptide/nickel transport system permease protein
MRMIGVAWRDHGGRLGLLLIAAVLLLAVSGLLLPNAELLDIPGRFASPDLHHWAGTDQLGRDLLARLSWGGAVAMSVAVATILLAAGVGSLLGIVAARAAILGRAILVLFDIVAAFPSLLFALAAVALAGPGVTRLVVLIALTLVPHFGRVARAQTLALSTAPFLEAARAIGASPWRILWRHILPNIAGPLLVLACLDIPGVIAIEAGMSFLGVGIPPPLPSWGGLLFDGYIHLDRAPWLCIFPCLALIAATLGFTLTGEALRTPR